MKVKTKKTLKKYLSIILASLLLFSVGMTYANSSFNLSVGSDPAQTSAYASTQQVVVVNDTLENPISFGVFDTNHKVSVSYSVGYAFDLRIQYSLSWSNGESTNNVILNYANRDNFIVDDSYVYVVESISAGTGSITIFTGVDFIDSTDSTYYGATLTITAAAEIYKTNATTYDTSHPLAVSSSDACTAWLYYRNTNLDSSSSLTAVSDYTLTDSAYVMVYNLRATSTNGVTHPGVVGAYNRTGNTTYTYTWVGGNKFYSGIGVYIITGGSAITLTAKATATWSTSTEGTTYETNVVYNYSSGWKNTSTYSDNDHVFPYYNYSYTISKYSAVYIQITDSIEITLAGTTSASDYSSATLTSSLTLNGTTFSGSKITPGLIENVEDADVSGTSATQTSSKYTILNSTLYEAGLYDTETGGLQNYTGEISITNNTSSDIAVTIAYTLRYYVSNGKSTLWVWDSSDSSYSHATEFKDETLWYRDENTGSYLTSTMVTSANIPAYSTVTVMTAYTVGETLKTSVVDSYGIYDCWVVVEPTVTVSSTSADIKGTENTTTDTTTTKTMTGITAITSIKGTSITLSLKNNTAYTLSGTTIVSLTVTEIVYVYTEVDSKPTYWAHNYWKYYTDTSGTSNTNSTYSEVSSSLYSRGTTTASVNISSGAPSYYNGASSGITVSITLQPNESAVIMTGTLSTTYSTGQVGTGTYSVSATAYASSSTTPSSISIVNEGSMTGSNSNAYIINNSSSAYYVRIAYSSASSTTNNFYASDNYIYYIGIVYSGEIVVLPAITSTNQLTIDSVAVSGNYTSSTLSSWESNAVEIFDSYFSHLTS